MAPKRIEIIDGRKTIDGCRVTFETKEIRSEIEAIEEVLIYLRNML
jgi:hypothetical protein